MVKLRSYLVRWLKRNGFEELMTKEERQARCKVIDLNRIEITPDALIKLYKDYTQDRDKDIEFKNFVSYLKCWRHKLPNEVAEKALNKFNGR